MKTYIPHKATLEVYANTGDLATIETNHTGTKRSEVTTYYKNPTQGFTVEETVRSTANGTDTQRKIIANIKTDTGMIVKTCKEDGEIVSEEALTNTEDGWCRITEGPQNVHTKEVMRNYTENYEGVKADVSVLDKIEVDPNEQNAPYVTAIRIKHADTTTANVSFEDRVVDGIVTNYTYDAKMKFHANSVDLSKKEIKENEEPYSVETEITKTLTHYEGIPLITKRTNTGITLGAYNTTTYCNRVRITDVDVAEHKVAQAIGIFFDTVNGISGLGHDDTFDEEYIKIDYDKIKYMFVYATYQEDLVSVIPQVKRITMIFTGADKKTAYLKLSGCIVYDTKNAPSHVNVKCTYCTYDDHSVNRNRVFTESYQFATDTILLAKMKRLAKRVRELANAHKHMAELTSKLGTNFVENVMKDNNDGLSTLD